MMKNIRFFKYSMLALIVIFLITACQNLDRPEYSDYPLDPPVITLITPSPSGLTVIRSVNPTAPITVNFQVEDDIEISSITVDVDGNQIASYSEFADNKSFTVEDLVYEASSGTHTLTITAIDSDDNVISLSTTFTKEDTPPYNSPYVGEMFYMNFDEGYADLVSNIDATIVGTPGLASEGRAGSDAYAGATDSYLTFPTAGMLGSEFSATMWYKLNAVPDRAGVLVIGPPDDANPSAPNNRKNGFRFFRENASGKQRFKLNVGNGSGDNWFDGGAAADVDPAVNDWVHLAFTISGTECVVYINGQVVKQGSFGGVDWTGCDIMSIMSGAPRFTGWGHLSDLSYLDDLRLFNVALTQSDITNIIAQTDKTVNFSFDGTLTDSVSLTDATAVGSPGYAGEAKVGTDAYEGATDSYLTFPTTGLLGSEFSATMWYKLNAMPDRAGVLVIGPPDDANPSAPNNRKNGFRFFRENASGKQRFKLNVGNGGGDNWFDGGAAADVDPAVNDWVHLAFTISGTECVVYINGQVVKQGAFGGVDWTGCDVMSIMSGAPRFTGWGHLSDLSYLDQLQIFDKALSQTEIQAIMAQ